MTGVVESPLCVFCRRRPVNPAWRPFCSERCKVQDLAKWADGSYRLAAEPVSDPQESQRSEDDREK
jgi:uncharacterized protein